MNTFKCEYCGCTVYDVAISEKVNDKDMCERCIEKHTDKFVWSIYHNSYMHIDDAIYLKESELKALGIHIVYDDKKSLRSNNIVAKQNKLINGIKEGMYVSRNIVHDEFSPDNEYLTLSNVTYIYVTDDLYFTAQTPSEYDDILICDDCLEPIAFGKSYTDININDALQIVCYDCASEYGYCETCNRYHDMDSMYSSTECNSCHSESTYNYEDEDEYEACRCMVCNSSCNDYDDYIVYTTSGTKHVCSNCDDRLLDYGVKLNINPCDVVDNKLVIDKTTSMVFGIELETCAYNGTVENSISNVHSSNVVLPTLAGNNLSNRLFVTKEDGSLPSNGYEISMQPLTLRAWQSQYIADIFKVINDNSRSYKEASCGIHISMPIYIVSDSIKLSLQKFFINNKDNISAIAQRQPNSYCGYADLSTTHLSTSHHNSIVFEDKRIEVRVFKSTTKYETIVSYVEFLHALISCIKINNEVKFDSIVRYVMINKDTYINLHNRFKAIFLKQNKCYYTIAYMAGDYNEA